jgi:hypothetical protein
MRYSQGREYQGAQAESFYQERLCETPTQMETFDDWIHASLALPKFRHRRLIAVRKSGATGIAAFNTESS